MGECIIARSSCGTSNNIMKNLPILNEIYTSDKFIKYNTSYTLMTIIDMYPTDCTYRWYCNDNPINGATEYMYTYIASENEFKIYKFFCIVTNQLGSVFSRTAIITSCPNILYIIKDTIRIGSLIFDFDSNMIDNSGDIGGKMSRNATSSTLNDIP